MPLAPRADLPSLYNKLPTPDSGFLRLYWLNESDVAPTAPCVSSGLPRCVSSGPPHLPSVYPPPPISGLRVFLLSFRQPRPIPTSTSFTFQIPPGSTSTATHYSIPAHRPLLARLPPRVTPVLSLQACSTGTRGRVLRVQTHHVKSPALPFVLGKPATAHEVKPSGTS